MPTRSRRFAMERQVGPGDVIQPCCGVDLQLQDAQCVNLLMENDGLSFQVSIVSSSLEAVTRQCRPGGLLPDFHVGQEHNGCVPPEDYDVSIDYNNYQCVVIGSMNLVCSHCKALKYKNEANGLCCANGIGTDSIHFLTHIQQYNNCFQMTSFGATNVVRENFMPTFKIQGQIYHRAGSLLPVSDSDNKFLQIYFMGNSPQEIDLRYAHNNLVKRSIVEQLQTLFHQHNQLIILFKTALDLMPSDNHKIVIRADKTPACQHTRRFNAPTIDEVAIVVVGENLESRDIVLHRRNDQLQRIKETHRSYDALQYPIIFWQGEDGYDLSIKMIRRFSSNIASDSTINAS
ncbi:uncharacterized protein LOC143190859 [Rhynchophorus ferrugineus]|uniref:uncharacterized protein LOC143190859 n=1 Tax=Rhynchophorus ferrugineus TaxID=354439 RepID=UPI003FCD64B6